MSVAVPPLLEVRGLSKFYAGLGRLTHVALDNVSFDLAAGETLGIVGESGSGKSTLARVLMRLTAADAGKVTYKGIDVLRPSRQQSVHLTRQMQIVFQDPNSCMNPRRTVRQALTEAALVAQSGRSRIEERVRGILDAVGLSPEKLDSFPHQLSGGQRQRVAIARALAVEPKVVIADECVSALDVSVQSAILNLLCDLQRERGLAYLFISHDLSVVRHMSDRILVMKSGQVVEEGEADAVISQPSHPYTRELVNSMPGPQR
jgi:ABC-type glutathione transport system ATPase component